MVTNPTFRICHACAAATSSTKDAVAAQPPRASAKVQARRGVGRDRGRPRNLVKEKRMKARLARLILGHKLEILLSPPGLGLGRDGFTGRQLYM